VRRMRVSEQFVWNFLEAPSLSWRLYRANGAVFRLVKQCREYLFESHERYPDIGTGKSRWSARAPCRAGTDWTG
jgi:hypothetical protein